MLCMLNPGDEVIIPSPYWVSYPEIAHLCEANIVTINASIENDFKVTAEQVRAAITPKSKNFLFLVLPAIQQDHFIPKMN